MADDETVARKATAEALIPRFRFERLLNQDQAGRRLSLLGTIDDKPTILLAERAAFSTSEFALVALSRSLAHVRNLGANDIYSWFLASSAAPAPVPASAQSTLEAGAPTAASAVVVPPDLKLNLIHPCTTAHIAKYTAQVARVVHETPAIYRSHVRPLMAAKRAAGALTWVYNILDGRTEQEDVILREHSGAAGVGGVDDDEGFLLLPDLNWDRATLTSLHLLAVVERRDLWSVRDLAPAHAPWLRRMRRRVLDATTRLYPGMQRDQVKLYVHYQPTYYHFHVHVVHVALEAGATQALGKAIGLEDVMERVESGTRMDEITLTYTIGEKGELWEKVWGPLKVAGELEEDRDQM